MEANWTEEMLDAAAGSVPVRIYRAGRLAKAPPLVMHLHGGAFLNGSPSAGQLVSTLLARAGAVVVSVDYSGASAHPFPAALHFSFDVLSSLFRRRAMLAHRKSSLFVAGEEAGGNLAAGVALMARDQQMVGLNGQILLSPMLDPCMATGSFRKAEANSGCRRWAEGWNRYLGIAASACHPYAVPAYCMRLAQVAPALVLTAEDDPMRDESLSYAQRLREAGVAVCQHVLTVKTGWPAAYSDCSGVQPEWGEIIRGHFAAFFQRTGGMAH